MEVFLSIVVPCHYSVAWMGCSENYGITYPQGVTSVSYWEQSKPQKTRTAKCNLSEQKLANVS